MPSCFSLAFVEDWLPGVDHTWNTSIHQSIPNYYASKHVYWNTNWRFQMCSLCFCQSLGLIRLSIPILWGSGLSWAFHASNNVKKTAPCTAINETLGPCNARLAIRSRASKSSGFETVWLCWAASTFWTPSISRLTEQDTDNFLALPKRDTAVLLQEVLRQKNISVLEIFPYKDSSKKGLFLGFRLETLYARKYIQMIIKFLHDKFGC